MKFDFMIVGQGIAGSVLSLSLIKSGYTVCVIDNPSLSSCSKVAAGIWNPVVFKRLTKSWLADELVPELYSFYKDAEKRFDTSLIHERHILKSFTEQQEQDLWLKKAATENLFLDPSIYRDLKLTEKNTISAYSKVLHAGNLDVASFLKHTKAYISSHQYFMEDVFDHSALEHEVSGVRYKSLEANAIVFCEGHLVSHNPFFNYLSMKPAKGEILTIQCEDLLLKRDILNKGIFIMPLGENLYKVGATYEWENLNDIPTEKARHELTQKLDAILSVPYQIIAHEAGVRPSITDRRPVIGNRPEFPNYFIFNGFGTKAVMLSPYFSKQFIKTYQTKAEFGSETSPNRYNSR